MKANNASAQGLPHYSRGEEIMNMVTHIAGGGLGLIGAVGCVLAALHTGSIGLFSTVLYGVSLVLVYSMSSIYHGLPAGRAKKVMQVLDHCSIYLLIAGTYTPIVLRAMAPVYPAIGWGLFAGEWGLTILAVTLTAVNLHKYRFFSKFCYIFMGWGIIFFLPQALEVLGPDGFGFLLAGGIAYTIGAVLFGLGQKIKWMHSIFHIFVFLGTALQMVTIAFYL